MSGPDGLAIIDKPAGLTSQQVVGRLRRLLGTRKVGHAGTLDPMATGVLVCGAGRATRLLGHLLLTDKRYLATIRLGAATVTDDAEGEVTGTADASGLDEAVLRREIAAFTGEIQQVPSAVSAIKVGGQRAYARVRAGESVELRARTVTVSRYDLLAVRRSGQVVDLDVDVECTSGTYVRALARDLGERLGVGGHLTALRRTRVGPFTLADATAMAADPTDAPPLLDLGATARRCFACVDVDDAIAARVRVGQTVPVTVPTDPTALLHRGELLALYRPDGDHARPVAVLADR